MLTERKLLVLIGAGGHGKVVYDIARASGWPVRGFIDDGRTVGDVVLDSSVLGNERLLENARFVRDHAFVVAIGDAKIRRRLSFLVLHVGGTLATIQHPSSVVSPYATIGDGTILAAGSIVNPSAAVGRFCVLNTGCTVDHDVQLGDGVQVGPGANLAGRVVCEEDVFVGTGAVVIPGVTVGADAIIGAGAVVVMNVPAGTTVVGNPARVIERHAAGSRRVSEGPRRMARLMPGS